MPAAAVESSPVAVPSAAATSATSAPAPPAPQEQQSRQTRTKPSPTPLAMPTGPCQDSDVRVAPALDGNPYAGDDVALRLELTTLRSPACTWEVSADTVAVRLTSGNDRIWSSQDCPAGVPKESVVLRNNAPTHVDVTWSGRRSDAECSRTTLWAEPGYYHVAAAAMGSEPQSTQFRLLSPAPVTITPSPTAEPEVSDEQERAKKRERRQSEE